MMTKCILLMFAALTLANCCSLGNGCASSEAPVAWDGLGAAPTGNAEPVELTPKKQARAKRDIIPGSPDATAAAPKAGDRWEQEQTADRDDEAKLRRTLKICSAC